MPITWNVELNVNLRRVLLSLINGKSLNLKCIASEIGIKLSDYKDKEFLKQKMRTLSKEDDDLEFLAYLRGKYLIVEDSNDMECLYIRYDKTSRTYSKKADNWLQRSKSATSKKKYEQLQLDIDTSKEGIGI